MANIINVAPAEGYKCVFCSSENLTTVRNTPDPRLKCNKCNGTFDGSQAKAAEEAGIIESSREELANAEEPEVSYGQSAGSGDYVKESSTESSKPIYRNAEIPKVPAYVFISKDRKRFEFSSKKEVKRTAIRWEEVKYDLYELTKKTSNVKVDIQ